MLTYDDVVTELKTIVKDFGPTHKVTGCRYFDIVERENAPIFNPVCLVGQLFSRILPADDIKWIAINANAIRVGGTVIWPRIKPLFDISDVYCIWGLLTDIQQMQDCGVTWDGALRASLGDRASV